MLNLGETGIRRSESANPDRESSLQVSFEASVEQRVLREFLRQQ